MGSVIHVLKYISRILPLFLHCAGFYWLRTRSANISVTQKILLQNLSLSEIIICASSSLMFLLEDVYGELTLQRHVAMIVLHSTFVTYVLIMISITIDRFAEVYLNIKYPIYWSTRKTIYFMMFQWLICVVVAVVSTAFVIRYGDKASNEFEHIYAAYFFPIADLTFVTVAVITYSYIATKLIRKKVQIAPITSASQVTIEDIDKQVHNQKKLGLKRPKPLLLPTLLITTYVVFFVIPDIIYFCMDRGAFEIGETFSIALSFAFYCGYISDALIYVLLSTTIGKELLKLIC